MMASHANDTGNEGAMGTTPPATSAPPQLTFDRREEKYLLDEGQRVRMRWERPALSGPDTGEQIMADGLSILEVKTCGGIPPWLVRELAELGARPASWSKYASACHLRLGQYGHQGLWLRRHQRPGA